MMSDLSKNLKNARIPRIAVGSGKVYGKGQRTHVAHLLGISEKKAGAVIAHALSEKKASMSADENHARMLKALMRHGIPASFFQKSTTPGPTDRFDAVGERAVQRRAGAVPNVNAGEVFVRKEVPTGKLDATGAPIMRHSVGINLGAAAMAAVKTVGAGTGIFDPKTVTDYTNAAKQDWADANNPNLNPIGAVLPGQRIQNAKNSLKNRLAYPNQSGEQNRTDINPTGVDDLGLHMGGISEHEKRPLLKGDGMSYKSPMIMPLSEDGSPDWESVSIKKFVMMPVNNKKSALHGRFVILEKLPNGLYRVAEDVEQTEKKNKRHKQDDDDDYDADETPKENKNNRDNDKEEMEKRMAGTAPRRYMINRAVSPKYFSGGQHKSRIK